MPISLLKNITCQGNKRKCYQLWIHNLSKGFTNMGNFPKYGIYDNAASLMRIQKFNNPWMNTRFHCFASENQTIAKKEIGQTNETKHAPKEVVETEVKEEVNHNKEEENIAKNKKWSKLKTTCYSLNALFLSYVIYKIYKHDGNLSKAEESIIKDYIKLFYTFEEKKSVKNSTFETCLNEELNKEIGMYFIQLDTDKPSGFLIKDALHFLSECNIGINEENKIIKNFINRGIGKSFELKKLYGCTLQEFAELIENVILSSKTKEAENKMDQPSLENKKQFYMNQTQHYIDSLKCYVKSSKIYVYIQKKKKNKEAENQEKTSPSITEQSEDLEKSILDKLKEYNKKYVDLNNMPLVYLLSKEELDYNRRVASSEMRNKNEEKEILLIEKKKLEEKIQLLKNLQIKKELTEIELKRLNNLKEKLKALKRTIRKEELKKYLCL